MKISLVTFYVYILKCILVKSENNISIIFIDKLTNILYKITLLIVCYRKCCIYLGDFSQKALSDKVHKLPQLYLGKKVGSGCHVIGFSEAHQVLILVFGTS